MAEGRKLRIQHVLVQPVVVYDDGEELTSGPSLNVVTLTLTQAKQMLDDLPDEVRRLQAHLEEDLAPDAAQPS